jgi:YVTN family beta-propeller protein
MHCPTVYSLSLFLATTLAFASPNPEQSIAPPARVFELLALNRDLPTAARPKYRSPCDIKASPDGKTLYVAEQTAKKLAVIDFQSKTLIKEIPLPNEPTGIAVAPDGNRVYVTCSSELWPSGMVCEILPASGKVSRRLPAGHGCRAPVISPVDNTLFICNTFDNDVSVVDVSTGMDVKRIKTSREPRCAGITPDGATLVVGNALPDQKSTDTLSIAAKITLVNALSRERIVDLGLFTGSRSVNGIAISSDGNYAFATHLLGSFAVPATRIDGGWIQQDNIAIVDIKGRKILNDGPLDLPMSGAANAWGIAATQDGKMLAVAHSGANFLSVVGLERFVAIAESTDYLPVLTNQYQTNRTLFHDLTKLSDITDRIAIKGRGPRALAVIGNKAITAGYFDDYLEIFDLAVPGSGTKTALSTWINLGYEVPKTSFRMGESAFFNASICLQKWQSCHSCHPFTRPDGLNWTLNQPVAAPKNSPTMLLSWWTPPTTWAGKRPDARESIRSAMISQLFLQPDPTVAETLAAFFMAIKPVPSPFLVKGRLSASALRGRELFNGSKAACVACHPGPLFTDNTLHTSGIPDQYDANIQWNTPTLIECWRTAPYGHLGSKLTVREMLDAPGMGAVSGKLTQEEIDDLVEFILSL